MSQALSGPDERLATLALVRLTVSELELVHLQLFGEDEIPVTELSGSLAYRSLAMLANRLARARCDAADGADDAHAARALTALREQVASRYAQAAHHDTGPSASDASDLAFVVRTFRTAVGRGIHPRELADWTARMREGPLDRDAASRTLQQVASDEQRAAQQPKDTASCWIMGTGQTIGLDDWQRRAQSLAGGRAAARAPIVPVRRSLRGPSRCLVTAIASLYKGAEHIEQFMENISSQSAFRDWCELIVIDAASPDGEADTIRRYMAGFPNIRYLRTPTRIGVYEAWNLGIREARGELLTNTNLDDLRRHDSLELQAATLQDLPDVDVVYQDFYYALEPQLPFERIAEFGFRSRVPRITPAVMLAFNPPHNAPMWRRRLHDELGPFDTRYRSAGDYEFWLRCVAAGKVFHRIEDAHVAYYQNPQGISTRADTPGHLETREITARYAEQLLCARSARGSGDTAEVRTFERRPAESAVT